MIGQTTCQECGKRFWAPLGQRVSNYIAKFPWALTKSLASIAFGSNGAVSDPDPLYVSCPRCRTLTPA